MPTAIGFNPSDLLQVVLESFESWEFDRFLVIVAGQKYVGHVGYRLEALFVTHLHLSGLWTREARRLRLH